MSTTVFLVGKLISGSPPATVSLYLRWKLLFHHRHSRITAAPRHSITLPFRARSPPINASSSPAHTCSGDYIDKTPLKHLARSITASLKLIRKAAIAGIIVGVLLSLDASALAASGGRMGGSSFSSGSSSSSASTSSYSSSMLYSEPSMAEDAWMRSSSLSSIRRNCWEPSSYVIVERPYSVPYWISSGHDLDTSISFLMLALVIGAAIAFCFNRKEDKFPSVASRTSLLKLQVCLLRMARSLQKDLNQIAETADTSTSEGLNFVLTETVLALLRHSDCCISAYASAEGKGNMEDGENCFNQLSLEERCKFDEETLVNVNNTKLQRSITPRSDAFSSNGHIVITILAAVKGLYKLPVIDNSSDLKEVLKKLGSISPSKTLAVEVLWTPQDENDTLSERELLEGYPLLRPL